MALLKSVLHPKFWFLATSPNFADSLGPSPTRGGGGGHDVRFVGIRSTILTSCQTYSV